MTSPRAFLARTPLRPLLEAEGFAWKALAGCAIADSLPAGASLPPLAIADLSPLPRLGFKGRGTIAAMKARGFTVEAEPNRAFRQPDGGLCLVLAPGEVILLSPLNGDGANIAKALTTWKLEDGERTYPLLRSDSHAWLAVSGEAAPAMFAKLCAVDLRRSKFADLAIAQTSVAKMSAIIVRADAGARPLYHVLADSAAALYFCSCLMDAAREFGGRLAGIRDVRDAHDEATGAERDQGPAT